MALNGPTMQRTIRLALLAVSGVAAFFKPAQVGHLRASNSTHVTSEVEEISFFGVPKQLSTHLGSRQGPFGFDVPSVKFDPNRASYDEENEALATGHYGRPCTRETRLEQCSDTYVCREGLCRQCQVSRDCGEQYKCIPSSTGIMLCIPRNLATQWAGREVVCTILVVFTAMLSAAAGMGGGGVYVPLLLLLLGFSTREAVPLSQCMILGGAVVNVMMFCGDRHPMYPQRPRIDYDVIMMMNPGLAAGVTIGVMCHLISPHWLIVTTLLVTLGITLDKTAMKGVAAWQKESAALNNSPRNGGEGNKETIHIKLADFPAFAQFAMGNPTPMLLIFGCWSILVMLNLAKAPQCSTMFWLQVLGMMMLCCVFTAVGAKVVMARQSDALEDVVDMDEYQMQARLSDAGVLQWTPTTLWMYPLFAIVAGFLGGFLGIGGGIIMSPLLLELGMIAEANQATTATFVFLSSSLATVQFVLLGKTMPEYVVWFTTWVVLATFVGQTGIDYMLRKYRRSSLIVLSIAGIIACSLVMMVSIGLTEVYHDFHRGADMGFKPHHLCIE